MQMAISNIIYPIDTGSKIKILGLDVRTDVAP
jgi:hypothetical protein